VVKLGAFLAVMVGLPALSLLMIEASGQTSDAAPKRGETISAPTFYKDVVPILRNKCQSCHRSGEAAPVALVTYEQTRPWAAKIAAAVEMRMMPPWFADWRYGHFANDPSLSEEQIATTAAWAQGGALAGDARDARDAPASRTWSEGWNIPPADLVVKMPKPVQIPARGEVEYTYEIVPTHFVEDKWVQMVELRPSSAAHVHHAVVYIRPPESAWLRHAPVGEPFTVSMLTGSRGTAARA
jgi:hypothetical protein